MRSGGGIPELEPALAAHLAGTYGTLAEEVIAAGPLEPLAAGLLEVEAQVLYARTREWAVSAEDVLRRRRRSRSRDGTRTPCAPGSRRCSRRDPRDRPGNDGNDVSRRRRASCASRPRLPRVPAALSAARLGRARPRGALGARARRRRGGAAAPASRRASSRRSGSRTSARRPSSGSARRARRSRPRSSGRTGAPPTRCRDAARRAAPRPHRARPRSLLLRHEARVAARANRRCRAAELAFGTVDSWLVWKLTGGACTPPTRRTRPGRCCFDLRHADWYDELLDLFGVDRALLPQLVRSSRSSARPSCSVPTLPIAGSPATSRRRSSATAASRPARRRRPTARALRARQRGTRESRGRPLARRCCRTTGGRAATRSRARSWRAAPRSSGCGTGSASSPTRPRARRSPRSVESTRRRALRAGVRRPRLAALERGGARADQRAHARHDAGRSSFAPRSRESRSRSRTSST